MIKLTCIKDFDDSFIEGEDYVLLTRRGGGLVEMLRTDGHARDFIMTYTIDKFEINITTGYGMIGYKPLSAYFNLVPINKRMVLFEKINNTNEFKLEYN